MTAVAKIGPENDTSVEEELLHTIWKDRSRPFLVTIEPDFFIFICVIIGIYLLSFLSMAIMAFKVHRVS